MPSAQRVNVLVFQGRKTIQDWGHQGRLLSGKRAEWVWRSLGSAWCVDGVEGIFQEGIQDRGAEVGWCLVFWGDSSEWLWTPVCLLEGLYREINLEI